MSHKTWWMAVGICWLGTTAVGWTDDGIPADTATPREFNHATIAKIVPGVTTAVEVQTLLGKPWRQTVFGSGAQCPPKPTGNQADPSAARNPDQAKKFNPYEPGAAVGAWDYRGRDSSGRYILRIEFDTRYITYLIAKIPTAGEGVAQVESPPPTQAGTPTQQ
jgi:hypothetical protein